MKSLVKSILSELNGINLSWGWTKSIRIEG